MTSEILNRIYYNPSNSGGFSGIEALHRAARQYGIGKKAVKDWLSGEYVYSLHRPARKRWQRNRTIVTRINEQFQADLVDMREFSNKNNNFKYILTVIDVLSKHAWAIPLKTKLASEVKKGLEKVFSDRKPLRLQTDQGREFNNQTVKDWLARKGVNYFTTKNTDIKCAIVERFNRTLKNRMFRYFTKTGKQRYIDVLAKLIEAYNDSYHRTIRMKPNVVSTDNEKQIFRNTYGYANLRELLKAEEPYSKGIKVGDFVRRKYMLKPLDRGYYPYWTDKTYKVDNISRGDSRPLYKVDNNRLYPEEVQRITGSTFRVEKILNRRKRRGKVEYLVKWLNHPSSENSWEPAENVFTTQDR